MQNFLAQPAEMDLIKCPSCEIHQSHQSLCFKAAHSKSDLEQVASEFLQEGNIPGSVQMPRAIKLGILLLSQVVP